MHAKNNDWMASNRLKLNPSKTKLVWLAPSQDHIKFEKVPMKVGQMTINPAMSVNNLGVILDNDLKLLIHVSNICRTCFYQIRQLRHIY